jgi:hypothetical protein
MNVQHVIASSGSSEDVARAGVCHNVQFFFVLWSLLFVESILFVDVIMHHLSKAGPRIRQSHLIAWG